jgi:uncharacterized protein YpmS
LRPAMMNLGEEEIWKWLLLTSLETMMMMIIIIIITIIVPSTSQNADYDIRNNNNFINFER